MMPMALLQDAIDPAHALLNRLTGLQSDNRARLLSLAIAGQESAWAARLQAGGGPARGYWQFERAGGVRGVLDHPATANRIKAVCEEINVNCDERTVYEAIAWHDILAACMARLLLYSDPRPLPGIGPTEPAWEYYVRNWRPGMPHHNTWELRYQAARVALGSEL